MQGTQNGTKSEFNIEEVCSLLKIKPYVLRFWESEFPEVGSSTNQSGERIFAIKDIETLAFIKKLLAVEKVTIEKAKREVTRLHREKTQGVAKKPSASPASSSSSKVFPPKLRGSESRQKPVPVASKAIKVPQYGVSKDDLEKIFMAKKKLKSIVDFSLNQ